MTRTVQPVERQYARLDSIAQARQGEDIKRREADIRSAEASINVRPLNATGRIDQHMVAQVVDFVADKRLALEGVRSLSGDDLVLTYCRDLIGETSPAPELRNSDGSPIARGARPSPIAPGMG